MHCGFNIFIDTCKCSGQHHVAMDGKFAIFETILVLLCDVNLLMRCASVSHVTFQLDVVCSIYRGCDIGYHSYFNTSH